MTDFQGAWLFVLIGWGLCHVAGSVVVIELIDWAPPCRRSVCVAEVAP